MGLSCVTGERRREMGSEKHYCKERGTSCGILGAAEWTACVTWEAVRVFGAVK